MKLQKFGYELHLKPVKLYEILSGDGDFLPVLKYLRKQGKGVVILARGPRTARKQRLPKPRRFSVDFDPKGVGVIASHE